MNYRIICELSVHRHEEQILTNKFLREIGLYSDSDVIKKNFVQSRKLLIQLSNETIYLTLKELERNYDMSSLCIANLCANGISFYVCGLNGDGFVFVPISNIQGIFYINEDEISNLSIK